MSQPVLFSSRPITLENGATSVPPSMTGTLEKQDAEHYAIRTGSGYLEVHGDGSYGYAPVVNVAGKARYVGWNLLLYPGESDRQDGLLHVTFLVAITTPV